MAPVHAGSRDFFTEANVMADTTVCAHAGCHCNVPQERAAKNNQYCSDYCEQHRAESGAKAHACGCGHPGCQ